MSEAIEDVVAGVAQDDPPEERAPRGDSLQARMRRRAEELSKRTTELFPVPRWDDMLAVELRVISQKKVEQIAERNARLPTDVQTLYSAADELIAATVNFHELKEEGNAEAVDPPTDWRTVAKGVMDLPEEVSNRQALIALVGELNVVPLEFQWRRWLQGQNTGISDQVTRDFNKTP